MVKKIAILSGTPDEFKEWLGAPKSYTFNSLKTQILQKAINEINLKIEDMNLKMFTARRGRKVVQVDIHNKFNQENEDDNKLELEVPMFNWLEK